MATPAGVPVTIMVYEKEGPGLLITCLGSGSESRGPLIESERVEMALLGGFDLDIRNDDESAAEKIEQLLKASFGEQTLRSTMQMLRITMTRMGYPLPRHEE